MLGCRKAENVGEYRNRFCHCTVYAGQNQDEDGPLSLPVIRGYAAGVFSAMYKAQCPYIFYRYMLHVCTPALLNAVAREFIV